MVILFRLTSQLLSPSMWTEGVGELCHAENAFAVEPLPLFLRHAGYRLMSSFSMAFRRHTA
jgi:hypothetical protein